MALRNLGVAQMRAALRLSRPQRRLLSNSAGRSARSTSQTTVAAIGSVSRGLSNVSGTTTPDVTTKFGDPSFWEGEYSSQYASQEELQPFEWFLPYEGGLRQHLLPFLESVPNCNRLLHVGCGTSEVGPRLASEPDLDLHVTDTDSSPSAVRLMQRRHTDLENYVCHETNVLNLPFPDGSYDAVVDKGTLDALLCRSAEDATGMAAEVHRVLCKGGVFLQITTEDPEARLDLLKSAANQQQHEPWSRTLFKEIGEGANSTYFMYVLVK